MANQKKTHHINLPIEKLQLNNGQLDGLGKNPRFIRDEKFEQLKRSLEESPEFLDARPLLVYPLEDGKFITVAGNMRLRAARELGFKEMPCYVFPNETPVEKLREYAIKDNVAFGEIDYEILKEDWDTGELADWGMDLPDFLTGGGSSDEDPEVKNTNTEIDTDDFEDKVEMKFMFTIEENAFVTDKLQQLGEDSKEQALLKLLGYDPSAQDIEGEGGDDGNADEQ